VEVKRKSAVGVMWSSGSILFAQLINIVLFFYLAKILDVNTFGQLAVALFLLDLFLVFSTVGFNAYLLKSEDFTTDKANVCFTASFFLVSAFILITILGINIFDDILPKNQAHYVLALCPILLINSFCIAADTKIQREFNYQIIAKIMVVSSVISGLSSLTLAIMGFEEWSIIGGRLIHTLILSALLLVSAGYFPRFQFNKNEIKNMYVFIKPLFLSRFITFTTERASQIMVVSFFGASFFALLSLAKRPYMEIQQITIGQINRVLVNTLSRSPDNHVNTCYRLATMVSAILVPIFIGLSAVSDVFLVGILGEKWQSSVLLMSLLGFEVLAIIFLWFTDSFFIANNKTQSIFKIVRIGFILRVVASLVAVQYSILYLVIINIMVSFLMIPVRYFYFVKVVKVSFFTLFKKLLPSIITGLIMYGIVVFYLSFSSQYIESAYLQLLTACMVGAIAYMGIFYLFFTHSFKVVLNDISSLTKG
jgi:O-antigen/teichoic acid export membrane protein